MEGLTTKRDIFGCLLFFILSYMKLYSVADEYIKYIRKSFPKVYSNKGKHETDRRNSQ